MVEIFMTSVKERYLKILKAQTIKSDGLIWLLKKHFFLLHEGHYIQREMIICGGEETYKIHNRKWVSICVRFMNDQ